MPAWGFDGRGAFVLRCRCGDILENIRDFVTFDGSGVSTMFFHGKCKFQAVLVLVDFDPSLGSETDAPVLLDGARPDLSDAPEGGAVMSGDGSGASASEPCACGKSVIGKDGHGFAECKTGRAGVPMGATT